MPIKSKKQYRYIMAMRSKYNSKKEAPEDMKWVFDSEWDNVDYDKLPEFEMNRYKSIFKKYKRYKEKYPFWEELRLSDLNKNQGLSNFTKPFRKQTSKLLGKSTNVVKLIDAKLDINNDWITYFFLTEFTPHYKKGQFPQEVEAPVMNLKTTKTYEIQVRILDILQWLDTFKIKEEISKKDLKDILEVASIKWWSSVPSFQFQGSNYILTQFDAAIYPETRPDNFWKKFHNSNNFLDKHSVGISNSILSFWINPMVNMLNSRLKKEGIL